jgi:hypothetical protein
MKAAASWIMDRLADVIVIIAIVWVLLLIGAASFDV